MPAEGRDLEHRALGSAAGALEYVVAGDTPGARLALANGEIYAVEQTVPIGRLDTLVAALRYGVADEDATAERNARITRGASTSLDPLDAKLLTTGGSPRAKADGGPRTRRELAILPFPAS